MANQRHALRLLKIDRPDKLRHICPFSLGVNVRCCRSTAGGGKKRVHARGRGLYRNITVNKKKSQRGTNKTTQKQKCQQARPEAKQLHRAASQKARLQLFDTPFWQGGVDKGNEQQGYSSGKRTAFLFLNPLQREIDGKLFLLLYC